MTAECTNEYERAVVKGEGPAAREIQIYGLGERYEPA